MPEPAILDTVVLRYFLLVERTDLLSALLGNPLYVPRVVFDPDEAEAPEAAKSEIGRSIWFQERVAQDRGRLKEARARAARNAQRLREIRRLHANGVIAVVDLTDEELRVFADLSSVEGARGLGLNLALGPGEAACLAVAVSRGWVLATDDQDALRALDRLARGHPYERIRRLLQRAVAEGLLAQDDANAVHGEMRRLGLWDRTPPFEAPTP
jgi:hypothetical protein